MYFPLENKCHRNGPTFMGQVVDINVTEAREETLCSATHPGLHSASSTAAPSGHMTGRARAKANSHGSLMSSQDILQLSLFCEPAERCNRSSLFSWFLFQESAMIHWSTGNMLFKYIYVQGLIVKECGSRGNRVFRGTKFEERKHVCRFPLIYTDLSRLSKKWRTNVKNINNNKKNPAIVVLLGDKLI